MPHGRRHSGLAATFSSITIRIRLMSNELECVIQYRPASVRTAFAVWSVILPIISAPLLLGFAGLIIATCLVLYFSLGGPAVTSEQFIRIMTCYCILALIAVPVAALTALTGDHRITITKDGICFPLFMLPMLKMRRQRPWSEFSEISYLTSSSSPQNNKIALLLTSGERINLDTQAFSQAELEQLLLSFEVCGAVKADNDVKQLRRSLKAENRLTDGMSYTEVWEQELGQRFHATVFVPLEPGQALLNGHLEVVRQLAFGGLSAIYLAQKDARELLILKEAVIPLNADNERKSKAIELFEREARLLVGLNHDRIAKVYDHFVENNRNYLLIEYINGQNLRQYVAKNGPQPEGTVLTWAKSMAEILAYLHSGSPPIVHRDITPENLILKDETIHLIDFGAANEFLGTATGTVVGKQAFISPEQFRGKTTPASDVYSLGGTLHFLLTGQNPLAIAVCNPRKLRPEISEPLNELIAQCTAQDSSSRPTAKQLADRLTELIRSPAAMSTG